MFAAKKFALTYLQSYRILPVTEHASTKTFLAAFNTSKIVNVPPKNAE